MFTLNCKGKLLNLATPAVMGILNATPDSFYSSSRAASVSEALRQAEKMLKDGARILDVGGQSTRPGSSVIQPAEELHRVLPIITALHGHFPESILSIDTYHSLVAAEVVAAGASMVNDISGGRFDANMLPVVAGLRVPYVCMHLEGSVHNMHSQTEAEDISQTVLDYFIEKTGQCEKAGIHDLILDPGFGFGKTIRQNFEIVKNLSLFRITGKPLLLGVSRKSSIWKTLGITANEALNGTTVLNTAGLLKGASILRVHDVKEAVEAVKLSAWVQ